MLFFLIGLFFLLVCLVLRFVQPELIYGVRQVLMHIRTNKAILDYEAGKSNTNAVWKEQLMNDFRFDAQECDGDYALKRVLKIKELYRTLDSNRDTLHGAANDPSPQVCILELSTLIGSLGKQLTPSSEYTRSIISSRGLLAYIGNELRRQQGEAIFDTDKSIVDWFIENPISIEQTIEILCTAVYGLAYRLKTNELEIRGRQSTRLYIDYWTAISKTEKLMRMFINIGYRTKYQTEEIVHARIKSALGDGGYNECLRRMEQSRKKSTGIAVDFLDFVYLSQLETLIFSEWDIFRKAFGEKIWLKSRLEKIISVRNEAAHNRPVVKSDEMLVVGYCKEIENRIEKFEEKTGDRRAN